MKNRNWLIVSGSIILSLTLFYLIFFKVMPPLDSNGPSSFSSFYVVAFVIPVLIAPILEEVRFRGFLTNSKVLQGLFLLLTPLSLVLTGWNTPVFILMLILYSLFFIYKYYHLPWVLDLLLIVSALFFSSHHLPTGVDFSWPWLPFLAISFSGALIFSWVIINKSFWWAVLFHGSWNLVLGIIFLFGLQFVSEDLKIIEADNYKFEWKRVPFLDSNTGSYKPQGNTLIINNMNLQDILGIVDPSLLDSFVVAEPFMKYEIRFETQDGSELVKYDLIKVLEMDSLIIRR
ncbi:MAG: CPBP family intramembrane metalloprotease [Algoriphagus sp.]|uniref:CPBP family intramembrane glutamic endopeptidase n=1 Tax=Algoriphagus sp. TaxID=1872435 RepID=UPI002613399E|nr:CPBP family intramembrane glutamic endopeptidase [Algoriphagus sp.]MDG1277429.1 CPBP family intramembrane metalloprotease [Algoriphagus sp.]